MQTVIHWTTCYVLLELVLKLHMTAESFLLILGITFFIQYISLVYAKFKIFTFCNLYLCAHRYAKPWTDHVNGISYCLFFPYSPEHLVSFASKLKSTSAELTNGAGGQIYLSIIASLKEAQHIMGSARSLFVGGFSISMEDTVKNISLNFLLIAFL